MSIGFQPHPQQKSTLPSKLRLLIVEDSQADAELIVLALKTANIPHTYKLTDTIAHCRQLLEQQTWDAVLSDFRLIGFTAHHILELLQQLGQQLPLILITGSLGEEAAVDCIKAGMTDYVLKDRLFRLPMVLERSLREFELLRQQQAVVAQARQQAQREALINRIVQTMRGTLVLSDVLQTTVDMLHTILQVDRCVVVSSATITDDMTVHYVSNATPNRETLLEIQCPIVDHYRDEIRQGRPVILSNTEQVADEGVRLAATQFNIRALLMLPLAYQQEYLGSICLHQCHHYREWTVDEVSLVQVVSDQCAIAIHQAHLFAQVQQQAQREQLLNQIGQALNSSLDPNHVLQRIVRMAGECFGVDRVLIFAIEAGQIQVKNEWLANEGIISMANFTAPTADWFDLDNLPDPHQPQSGYVLHVPDYGSLPQTLPRQKTRQSNHIQSLLGVSILIRDKFFGGLELHTTTYRTFSQDEIDLLQRIADKAAIALYNAQSYDQLEKLVQERTQELEKEKQLSEAANRTKSQFLANMSHELRTPLTGILGFSSVLLKQIFGPLTEKQQQYISSISACGEHLLELINDLLDLSKIEAGREELTFELLDIREMCEVGMFLANEQAKQQDLQMTLTIATDLKTCIADRRRLKQILFNLLANAVKFTQVGSVTLTVSKDDQYLQFAVTDTGIGISQADLAQLFQPFQQLDGGLDKHYQGTGLGLVLARRLAQLHGGDITVTSELGRGSCFTLLLPQNFPCQETC